MGASPCGIATGNGAARALASAISRSALQFISSLSSDGTCRSACNQPSRGLDQGPQKPATTRSRVGSSSAAPGRQCRPLGAGSPGQAL